MGPAADLTVVVLSWNTRDLTLAALRAVPEGCAPFRARIVCVDNASEDGTAGAVRRAFPDVVVVEASRNLGYARGNNLGLPGAQGRAVVFLNSDAAPREGALAHALRYLDAHPEAGVVCPRLVYPDGTPQRAAWGFPTASALLHQFTPLGWLGVGREAARRTRPDRGADERTGRVDAVSGACLAIRRDLCERLGGFDPGYPFYFEDVDLCARAQASGAEVHVVTDGPAVVHHGGASSALAEGATRLPLLVGALRFQRGRLSPAAYAAFSLAFKSGVVVRSIVELLRAPAYATVRSLRGRHERAARTWRTARERRHLLERDVLALLRAEPGATPSRAS